MLASTTATDTGFWSIALDNLPEEIQSLRLTSTDQAGNVSEEAVPLVLTSDRSAPVFTSAQSVSRVEREGENSVVYQAAANDLTNVQYSLEGHNADLFAIDAGTGKVRLLKYKLCHSIEHYFTVRATDEFGKTSERAIHLSIEDSSVGFWKDGGYRVDAAALKDVGPSGQALVLKDRNTVFFLTV